jgi:hypothetical protein
MQYSAALESELGHSNELLVGKTHAVDAAGTTPAWAGALACNEKGYGGPAAVKNTVSASPQ